jgi:superoxide dismutase, Cu-Zn family
LTLFEEPGLGYAALMTKRVVVASSLLFVPIVALSGCGSEEPAGEQPTSPETTTTGAPEGTERLSTQLSTADGTPVANATFDFANGYATITVETVESGILSPGFHGLHIHSVGKCEANSVAPTGGEPGDFNSAGGHFQVPGHTGHPASGDLTSLQVRSDGSATLVTASDAFTAQDLLAGEKTALMIHQDADNFANIPERYTRADGTPGPDQETLATGDAGARVACGVIDSASETATATTTTSPTTVVTTPASPAPTAETTSPVPSPAPTATETITETVPTGTATTPPTSPPVPPTTTPPR